MIKLLESLIGGAEGEGSRRVQMGAIGLLGILTVPELCWPITAITVAVVGALTVTDVLKKD